MHLHIYMGEVYDDIKQRFFRNDKVKLSIRHKVEFHNSQSIIEPPLLSDDLSITLGQFYFTPNVYRSFHLSSTTSLL